MSSPFQQKFSLKNPFGKNPKLSSVDTESDLPEAQFAGDDIESYDPKGAVVAERLKENYPESVDNKKKTQAKRYSPLDMYDYVSTAPHFQRLQDNIARAFTPTRGGKTKAEKEAGFKGETKKVSKNLKETTDKGFKDYSAEADFNSNSGSVFDTDENNYFNKFGQ